MNELLRRVLFLPEQASHFARELDGLHYFVIITTMIASTAIGLTALGLFVRFRRRDPMQSTPPIYPRWWIEALFIGVPLVFFVGWFAIGYRQFAALRAPPPDAMDVYVMGKQWMWKFSYPDGPSAVDVLRVPEGRPVRLLITSRDVIHSFFVPEFRIKQDAIPGRYTEIWFTATKPGRYQVLCAEYCGTNHSMMRGAVEVMAPEAYDAWWQKVRQGLVAAQDSARSFEEDEARTEGLVAQGLRAANVHGCLKCHTLDGTAHIGPSFLNLYLRRTPLQDGRTIVADEAYLTESMMDPLAKMVRGYQPVMPSFQGKLAGPEAAALVELIKSLQSTDAVRIGPQEPLYEPVRR